MRPRTSRVPRRIPPEPVSPACFNRARSRGSTLQSLTWQESPRLSATASPLAIGSTAFCVARRCRTWRGLPGPGCPSASIDANFTGRLPRWSFRSIPGSSGSSTAPARPARQAPLTRRRGLASGVSSPCRLGPPRPNLSGARRPGSPGFRPPWGLSFLVLGSRGWAGASSQVLRSGSRSGCPSLYSRVSKSREVGLPLPRLASPCEVPVLVPPSQVARLGGGCRTGRRSLFSRSILEVRTRTIPRQGVRVQLFCFHCKFHELSRNPRSLPDFSTGNRQGSRRPRDATSGSRRSGDKAGTRSPRSRQRPGPCPGPMRTRFRAHRPHPGFRPLPCRLPGKKVVQETLDNPRPDE